MASNGFPLSYVHSLSASSGRLSVPVRPNLAIYANFEHVSGVPSTAEYVSSIDKIKILDTLIDRLSAAKSEPLPARERSQDLTPDRIDALIEQYGRELHSLASKPSLPYLPAATVEPGMLVSLAA
ncbi:MAG: hypothetical protein NT080_01010 [Spirochaetes bacterium]|nr:hypothetical protein [Spirochaetota bacterium]